MLRKGIFRRVIGKVGVGKESDVYKCEDGNGEEVILKLARLGRTSFRAVKTKRDYLKDRTSFNWLFLSKLAA
jgi:RIO kinase 2